MSFTIIYILTCSEEYRFPLQNRYSKRSVVLYLRGVLPFPSLDSDGRTNEKLRESESSQCHAINIGFPISFQSGTIQEIRNKRNLSKQRLFPYLFE